MATNSIQRACSRSLTVELSRCYLSIYLSDIVNNRTNIVLHRYNASTAASQLQYSSNPTLHQATIDNAMSSQCLLLTQFLCFRALLYDSSSHEAEPRLFVWKIDFIVVLPLSINALFFSLAYTPTKRSSTAHSAPTIIGFLLLKNLI